MRTHSLDFQTGVTLLGGGDVAPGALETALARAPALVCADGGANQLAPDGPRPNAVIGDLDSLADAGRWRARLGDDLIHVAEQDSTDFEKCLYRVTAPFFIGVGFLGGRIDHELGVLSALIADDRPIILMGVKDVVCSAGTEFSLELSADDRFSIFPMRAVTALSSKGLRWPVEGMELAAGGAVSVSNRVETSPVSISLDRAGAVAIAPLKRLDQMIAAARKRP
ncbi:MAG: thiamine diphosphokinase [Pikeienuella sp.]